MRVTAYTIWTQMDKKLIWKYNFRLNAKVIKTGMNGLNSMKVIIRKSLKNHNTSVFAIVGWTNAQNYTDLRDFCLHASQKQTTKPISVEPALNRSKCINVQTTHCCTRLSSREERQVINIYCNHGGHIRATFVWNPLFTQPCTLNVQCTRACVGSRTPLELAVQSKSDSVWQFMLRQVMCLLKWFPGRVVNKLHSDCSF